MNGKEQSWWPGPARFHSFSSPAEPNRVRHEASHGHQDQQDEGQLAQVPPPPGPGLGDQEVLAGVLEELREQGDKTEGVGPL